MAEIKLVVMDLPSIKYEYVYEGFKELTDSRDCDVIILPPGTPREEMIKECSDADGIEGAGAGCRGVAAAGGVLDVDGRQHEHEADHD